MTTVVALDKREKERFAGGTRKRKGGNKEEDEGKAEELESITGDSGGENEDDNDSFGDENDNEKQSETAVFSNKLKNLVSGWKSTGESNTILQGRKTKTKSMKQIQEEKAEIKLKKERAAKRLKLNELNLEKPQATNLGLERQLKKIATRGVVALFNAIRNHQTASTTAKHSSVSSGNQSEKRDVNSMSKGGFLELLRKGTEGDSTSKDKHKKPSTNYHDSDSKANTTWSALRDDYMLGAGLKDYDKESIGSAGDSEDNDGSAEEDEESDSGNE